MSKRSLLADSGRSCGASLPGRSVLPLGLCDQAQNGQILITQRVYAEVEELVQVQPIGELTFKGFQKPVSAFQVLGMNGR